MKWLDALASIASVITAVIAAYAYGHFRLTRYRRRVALENLLATKNQPGDDSLEIRQCASALTLTDEQVIEAARRSKKIESRGGLSIGVYRLSLKKKSN